MRRPYRPSARHPNTSSAAAPATPATTPTTIPAVAPALLPLPLLLPLAVLFRGVDGLGLGDGLGVAGGRARWRHRLLSGSTSIMKYPSAAMAASGSCMACADGEETTGVSPMRSGCFGRQRRHQLGGAIHWPSFLLGRGRGKGQRAAARYDSPSPVTSQGPALQNMSLQRSLHTRGVQGHYHQGGHCWQLLQAVQPGRAGTVIWLMQQLLCSMANRCARNVIAQIVHRRTVGRTPL